MVHAGTGEEMLKKQPRRRMRDWRRLMSLCGRRQRAATKVVLSCYLDKERTGWQETGAVGDRRGLRQTE
jgi:hypothetical protein